VYNNTSDSALKAKAVKGAYTAIAKLPAAKQYGAYTWVYNNTSDSALEAKAEKKMAEIKAAGKKSVPSMSREEFLAELAKKNSPAPA
jgi:hypothetical protein